MPDGVCRSSGSRVRLPTSTTRLMLPCHRYSSSSRRRPGCADRIVGDSAAAHRHWPDGTPLDPTCRARWRITPSSIFSTRETSSSVPGVGGEVQQVVAALALVADLVGELAPPPRRRAGPSVPPPSLDELARARDDLRLAVVVQSSGSSSSRISYSFTSPVSFPRSVSASPVEGAAGNGRSLGEAGSCGTVSTVRRHAIRSRGSRVARKSLKAPASRSR